MRTKLKSRQVQVLQTKNKIYKVAIDLMEKKGFDNITVEDISRKAGVSVGAFYHYFKSKKDILFEIFHRFDKYFENEVHLTDGNTSEQIILFFKHYARYTKITGVDTAKKLYGTMDKLFLSTNRYMLSLLNNIIKTGQFNGDIIDNIPSEKISEYLLIAARGIAYDWCLHDGNYDIEASTVQYFERLIPIFETKKRINMK